MNTQQAKEIVRKAILTKDKETISRYLKRYFELKGQEKTENLIDATKNMFGVK